MQGIISCGHRSTAEAANSAIMNGGNAFDAVICAMIVACVSEPNIGSFSSALLGLFKTRDGGFTALNAFARAPSQRNPDVKSEMIPLEVNFKHEIDTYYYGRGTVAASGYFHAILYFLDYGKLPFEEHLNICIDQLKAGIPLEPFFNQYLRFLKPTFRSQELYDMYCDKNSDITEPGEIIHNERFVDLLDTMRNDGIEVYTRGEIPDEIITLIGNHGHLSREDLSEFKLKTSPAHKYNTSGTTIYTPGFPSWGGKIIEELIAMDFIDIPTILSAGIEDLKRKMVLRKWKDSHETTSRKYGGTGHLSIADTEGNILSLTYSLGEGSGYMTPYSGIHLNNILGEPALFSEEIDRWKPSEQPISMMSPVIIQRQRASIALGTAGSVRIPQVMYQTIMRLIEKMEKQEIDARLLREINDAPRVFYKNNTFHIEPGYGINPEISRTHSMNMFNHKSLYFGGINIVGALEGGELIASADIRRDGCVKILG